MKVEVGKIVLAEGGSTKKSEGTWNSRNVASK